MELRPATAADASAVRDVYAPFVEHTAVSFETEVPSVEEVAARITSRWPRYPWLVAVEASDVVGYAYAGPFASRAAYGWSVETSIYLAEPARGRGVGRALYVALYATLTAQGYRRVLAGITLPNHASVTLHERMGLVEAGRYPAVGWKLGRWHDVGWWQGDLAGDDARPLDPRPLDPRPLDPRPLDPRPLDALGTGVLVAALRAGMASPTRPQAGEAVVDRDVPATRRTPPR